MADGGLKNDLFGSHPHPPFVIEHQPTGAALPNPQSAIRHPPSKISLIIPALDEERHLARTLEALARAAPPRPEVIVVDGGSRDRTLEIARSYRGVKALAYGRACRALQMNAGAGVAAGEILLFLHADVILPAAAFGSITAALADPEVLGGCFEVCFPEAAPRAMRLMAAGINLRTRLFRTATGDQAIFVRRAAFDEIGGYPEIPLMEDVELFAAIKRRGRVTVLPGPVEVSPRRWLRRGIWRTMLLMYALRGGYGLGLRPAALKKFFRDVR
jgi:rSAM/selenodomain-associated transferase 2